MKRSLWVAVALWIASLAFADDLGGLVRKSEGKGGNKPAPSQNADNNKPSAPADNGSGQENDLFRKKPRTPVFELASRVAEQVFIPFTVGGGIRTLADIRSILQAGADKISLNTVAVENPTLISEAAERFGIQCVVVAIDARWNGAYYEVYTHGGAHPNRQKCHRVGANGRSAWRRRNLVDQYGSRRHSAWLRTHLDTPSR